MGSSLIDIQDSVVLAMANAKIHANSPKDGKTQAMTVAQVGMFELNIDEQVVIVPHALESKGQYLQGPTKP